MLKLLKNAEIFAPQYMGKKDVLVCDQRIAAVDAQIDTAGFTRAEIIDLSGTWLVPGYIDGHVHITGGGGEQGAASRVREAGISEIVTDGVTTVLGMLGTDSVSRSLENLLTKARALEEEGISAYILTGAYRYPSPVMTDCIMRDIMLIDKVVGVKIAASDHRSSGLNNSEFIRLCTEARVGGMLSGKSGLAVIHMGSGVAGFRPILDVLENSDVPMRNLLPTHCGRTEKLFKEAIQYGKDGGNFDLTAESAEIAALNGGAAKMVAHALQEGVDISRITISSDAYGSQPIFDEKMTCVGITYSRCSTLHDELRRMIRQEALDPQQALQTITSNVADRLGLVGKKGTVTPGADADFVILNKDLDIERVFARGKEVVREGLPLVKGQFET